MIRRTICNLLLSLLAATACAQDRPPLAEWLAKAVANHPRVAASLERHRSALAAADSAAAPANPVLEVAPGLGFTNSNFLLGQSFDLSGTRAARARHARAAADSAAALLRQAQLAACEDVLQSLATVHAAERNLENAQHGVRTAKATTEAVRKRLDIGEAPALQLTRAEIEGHRATQAVILAEAEVLSARATLSSLLGRPFESPLPALEWDAVFPEAADKRRPEIAEAQAQVAVAGALLLEARRGGGPELSAGVASDIWSTNRRPFDGERFGVQITLRMPLFDRGSQRNSVRSAEAHLRARQADLEAAERAVALDIDTAKHSLGAARRVAASYTTDLLPRSEQMLAAMQSGFETGLTGFLDVLEAQRSLEGLRSEASSAQLRLHRALVRMAAATAHIPGLEVPQP